MEMEELSLQTSGHARAPDWLRVSLYKASPADRWTFARTLVSASPHAFPGSDFASNEEIRRLVAKVSNQISEQKSVPMLGSSDSDSELATLANECLEWAEELKKFYSESNLVMSDWQTSIPRLLSILLRPGVLSDEDEEKYVTTRDWREH